MICSSITMNVQVLILIVCPMYILLFSQNDYKLIHERLSLDWYNPDYVKEPKVVLFHYTRYQKRINMSAFILQDLGNNMTETIKAYKFQSNEYRDFPMLYTGNGCSDDKYDKFGTSAVHYNTNFKGCPVNKGFYYLVNVFVDEMKFPPFAPRGKFMLEVGMYHKKTILLTRIQWYIKIEATNPLERVIMAGN